MKNPYVRLREACGISQKAFLEKYSFSKITLIYTEAGMFPDISDRLNAALASEVVEKGVDAHEILAEYDATTLNGAYHNWQSLSRKEATEQFYLAPPFEHSASQSPFYRYILNTCGSIQSFCKTLKVPAATVTRYAQGKTFSMPGSVEDALREIEWPFVGDMVQAQAAWSQEHVL